MTDTLITNGDRALWVLGRLRYAEHAMAAGDRAIIAILRSDVPPNDRTFEIIDAVDAAINRERSERDATPNDAQRLIAEVSRLRAENTQLRALLGRSTNMIDALVESALPCDHPEDRRFYNGATATCEDCFAVGNVVEGDAMPNRIVTWNAE